MVYFLTKTHLYTQYNGDNSTSTNSIRTPNSSDYLTLTWNRIKNTNNWITVNHDIYGTRHSNQTLINKENVTSLQVKWRLINDVEIQNPPIIIGNTGYIQDYSGTVIAFDADTGEVLWKVKAGNGPTMGLTFSNGIVFGVVTAYNATVVAINATDGKIVWQSPLLGDPKAWLQYPYPSHIMERLCDSWFRCGGDNPNGVGLVQGKHYRTQYY